MLDHYNRTFLRMQQVMWLVTAAMLFLTHSWVVSVSAFAMMQVGAVLGVIWGPRLKTMFLGARARGRGLPMRRA
jgi:hypothetical protein